MDLFRFYFGRKGEILEKEIFLVNHAFGYLTWKDGLAKITA
jgi:hypothetical protein